MTHRKDLEGRGGSTQINKEGRVEHTGGTLNPGDPGYDEAHRKAPLHDKERKGTLSRAATFADANEEPPESQAALKAHAAKGTPPAADTKGGK